LIDGNFLRAMLPNMIGDATPAAVLRIRESPICCASLLKQTMELAVQAGLVTRSVNRIAIEKLEA
jgi:hypothetical protein